MRTAKTLVVSVETTHILVRVIWLKISMHLTLLLESFYFSSSSCCISRLTLRLKMLGRREKKATTIMKIILLLMQQGLQLPSILMNITITQKDTIHTISLTQQLGTQTQPLSAHLKYTSSITMIITRSTRTRVSIIYKKSSSSQWTERRLKQWRRRNQKKT